LPQQSSFSGDLPGPGREIDLTSGIRRLRVASC
jgi:hypothetical protein